MPNSLKCRLKGLVRKGLLSEKDLSRIYTDNDVIEELEKIKSEINKQSLGEWYVGRLDGKSENVTTIESINKIIDKHISELKGDNE